MTLELLAAGSPGVAWVFVSLALELLAASSPGVAGCSQQPWSCLGFCFSGPGAAGSQRPWSCWLHPTNAMQATRGRMLQLVSDMSALQPVGGGKATGDRVAGVCAMFGGGDQPH